LASISCWLKPGSPGGRLVSVRAGSEEEIMAAKELRLEPAFPIALPARDA
jgi:hypothetical protein